MIEMVYSGKEPEQQGEVRIPKNIRQIGNGSSGKKVYIEDYVMTQLKRKPEKEQDIRYGVLLGEVKKGKGNTYIFIKGMVEVLDVIENSLIFNDDIWSGIYKDIKQFFNKLDIVGWFVSVPYRVSDDMTGIRKLHLDNFAGNDKVCFLSDRTENEDGFYMYEKGNLEKQSGYYIYYEKNEKMKKYVKNQNNAKKSQSQETSKKSVDTRPEPKPSIVEEPIKNKESAPKSFRQMLKESGEENPGRQGRMAYGISGLLIVALLLSTVVMLNNYGELKNIKQTLSDFSMEREAKAVNQILDSYNSTESQSQKQKESQSQQSTTQQQTVEEKGTEQNTTNRESVTSSEQITPQTTQKAVKSSYSGTYHTVKAGQTLYDISMKYYNTSEMVDEIKEYNDIDDDYTIIEGQKILLP